MSALGDDLLQTEVYAPVCAYDEDVGIYGQILAVSTADIETDRAGGKTFEEALYDGPRLSSLSVSCVIQDESIPTL